MPSIATQLIISLGFAILAILIDRIVEKKVTPIGVALSISVGLVGLVVQLMFMVENIEKQLDLAKAVSQIENGLVRRYAEETRRTCEQKLKEAREGTIWIESKSSMMRAYYDVFEDGEPRKVDATSMVDIEKVWGDTRGEKALDVNRAAVRNGCDVVRIFIGADAGALQTTKAREHIAKQVQAGVKVFWVLATDLEAELRKDFLVADGEVVLEYKVDNTGDIATCMLSSDPQKVNRYDKYFTRILDAAERWPPQKRTP